MAKMIQYIIGDATNPIGEGNKIITHITNDIGGWGKGFVLSLSKKWKEPELFFHDNTQCLRNVQFVNVTNDITVANMCAQQGIYWKNGIPPIRYEALKNCLQQVATYALQHNATIHAPRFGAGLAGGDWNIIQEMINEHVCSHGISVYIYDLETTENLSDEIKKRQDLI